MNESEAAGVERDGCGESRRCREREPGAVGLVSYDRAASAGQLRPQLVPSARRGNQFDKRHFPKTFHHTGPNMTFPPRDVLGFSFVIRGTPASRRCRR